MNRVIACVAALTVFGAAEASWYWPFGSDSDEADAPRLSELMEPASELIDDACDLATDGKTQEAVEKYRKALFELDRIETENPERAKTQEFASLRNKRAYVNAAIDTLLLDQVRNNAKSVAVSDTVSLEARLKAERTAAKERAEAEKAAKEKAEADAKAEAEKAAKEKAEADAKAEAEKTAKESAGGRDGEGAVATVPAAATVPAVASPLKGEVLAALGKGDYEGALVGVAKMLAANPKDVAALNLRGAAYAAQGRRAQAEAALDEAIAVNPKSHFAYYNMALLLMRADAAANKVSARKYYQSGRAVGGPVDAELEGLLK